MCVMCVSINNQTPSSFRNTCRLIGVQPDHFFEISPFNFFDVWMKSWQIRNKMIRQIMKKCYCSCKDRYPLPWEKSLPIFKEAAPALGGFSPRRP